MTDPLIVPMHLDAMVLNVEASEATPFLRFQPDYLPLPNLQPVGPPPFTPNLPAPDPGIHLHWTLPRALRHSPDGTAGGAGFPLVPNRWLVVRVPGGAVLGQAVKAWLVVSDAPAGTSPYVDPSGLQNGFPNPISIGRTLAFDAALKALPDTGPLFLQAVGPGTPTFFVYSPGVQDVFALYDDVSDPAGTPIEAGTFTYHVTGWYSDPASDPLAGATWTPATDPSLAGASVDDALGLAAWLGGGAGPAWMLVHALVSGVAWARGADNPAADDYPENVPETVQVAFGDTAIEALAATLRLDPNRAAEADLLEAFQYGLLEHFDAPASARLLDRNVRQHWFGASPAGSTWTVVAPEPAGSTALPAPPPPPLTTAQQQALAALNAAQREADRQARILASMRWNLWALWWKYQYLFQNFTAPGVDTGWMTTQLQVQLGMATPSGGATPYLDQVTTQVAAARAAAAAAAAARDTLVALLAPATQIAKETSLPQYHAANDPVVVATGLGRSTNLDPVGDVAARLPSQLVTALTVDGTAYCTDGSCEHPVAPPPLTDPNTVLPPAVLAGIEALHAESLLLSPALLAQVALGDASRAPDVAAAIAALPAPGAGARFAPSAGSYDEWEQPWVPLLLDWEVTLLSEPAYTPGSAPVYAFDPANWTFDGTDYRWTAPIVATGPNFDEADSLSMQLQGRTFITPQLTFTLADQLDQWLAKHKLRDPSLEALLEDLDHYLDTVRAQDVLSQRLSGLRSLFLQRDPTPTVPATGAVAAALGDEPPRGFPRPYPDAVTLPIWDYAPVAGTFMAVQRLTVIDFMGRSVNLMLANWSTDPLTPHTVAEDYFYPIASKGLKAPSAKDPKPGQPISSDVTQRMLALGPRLTQDAQVAFRLNAGDGRDEEYAVVTGGNPICGWVMPNHLDRSLALYAPDGTAWGELYLSAHPGGVWVPMWQPDPTNPQAPASVADIPNHYIAAWLTRLSARTDDGAGVNGLIETIDQALWTIDSARGDQDPDTAVLVGRPLAIVRAELSLRLRGLAATSQDWWSTFAADSVDPTTPPDEVSALGTVDGGLGELTWPVRLGDRDLRDDGLIGYFADVPGDADATWGTFHAVQVPAEAATPYLHQIGDAGDYVTLRFVDDTVTAPDPAAQQVQRLTLLVDPAASVHAFSGILPVTPLDVPSPFVTPALRTMTYLLRAGPLLTPPGEVRLPRPADRRGTWSWFDRVGGAAPVTPADAKATLPDTPPLALEGWLRLTPNPPDKEG